MNCETFRASTLDWLEGSLGDDARFRAHRAACAACGTLVAGFEENERILRGARVPAAPAELWSRIAVEIGRPAPRRRPWIPLAAAAALLLGLAGLFAASAPRAPELDITIVDAGPALGVFVPRYEAADTAFALGD